MSKASATSCTWTPDISLSFTAFTLNSAVYREIFLGPFVLPIHTSSVRPECQLYRGNCRVRCSRGLGGTTCNAICHQLFLHNSVDPSIDDASACATLRSQRR